MALPLIPLVAGGALGAGGAALGSMLGGGKKEQTINEPYAYYAPVQQYSPSMQYAPQSAYSYVGSTYVIESPAAYVSPRADAAPYSAPTQTTYPEQSAPSQIAGGVNWTLLGVIGIGGLLAVALVTAPPRKKRRR